LSLPEPELREFGVYAGADVPAPGDAIIEGSFASWCAIPNFFAIDSNSLKQTTGADTIGVVSQNKPSDNNKRKSAMQAQKNFLKQNLPIGANVVVVWDRHRVRHCVHLRLTRVVKPGLLRS
jgi:hypothetical protein